MMTQNLFKTSIKKNDVVQVIAGREKGKTGKVLGINSTTGRIVVEKVNLIKRHIRPTQKNPQGGVLEKESPLHYSNVLLLCPKCNRGVRHGKKWIDQVSSVKAKKGKSEHSGKQVKVRFCKSCNETLSSANSV
jgi:large subunit ribosomal protein L24